MSTGKNSQQINRKEFTADQPEFNEYEQDLSRY